MYIFVISFAIKPFFPLNFQLQIARRILSHTSYKNKVSRPIVKIGITGIALGVAVMILTMAIVTGFQKEIIAKITTFTAHLQINDYDLNNSLEASPVKLSDAVLNKIRALPNIKHIQSYATKNGILKAKTENEGVVLKGVDASYDWSLMKPYIEEGTVLNLPHDAVSQDILVSRSMADRLHLKLGQKLLLYFITKKKLADTTVSGENYINYEAREKTFYIKGIYNTSFSDVDKNLVMVDLKQIQKLNYWSHGEVAGYEIYLRDFSLLERTQEQVSDLAGYDYAVTSVKENQANIFSWLDMVDVNAVIIIVLMVLVAAINMISALLILILERTNMVGILKALGMANTSVRGIFMHVSLRLLARGLLFGNIAGIGLCLLQMHFKLFSLNAETYYLNSVPINMSLLHIVLVNVGTTLCCLLMMLLPTLILTRITPVKAIRFS